MELGIRRARGGAKVRLFRLRVQNYKCIVDSGSLDFGTTKMVVLLGQNSVGKTAFLEAINACFWSRGRLVLGEHEGMTSTVHLDLELSEGEFSSLFPGAAQQGIVHQYVHVEFRVDVKAPQARIEELWASDQPGTSGRTRLAQRRGKDYNIHTKEPIEPFLNAFYDQVSQRFIFLGANRTVPSEQRLGDNQETRLDATASNLNGFLHDLHNNNEPVFDAIQRSFIEVYPDVERLETKRNKGNTNVHLKFQWAPRGIPLQDCGTGQAHTLMLLALLHAEQGRFVILDEPHAFLHPAAEKLLYRLMEESNHPSFLVATHSTVLMNSPIPKATYLVTRKTAASEFRELTDLSDAFLELGLQAGDAAFFDRILLVEGPTERQAVPLILSAMAKKTPRYDYAIESLDGGGTVVAKGKVMTHLADLLDKVYQAMSTLPMKWLLLLDREHRSDQHIEKLRNAYPGHVQVLPRLEFENYLLDSEAVAQVISARGTKVDAADISEELLNALGFTAGTSRSEADVEQAKRGSTKGSAVLTAIFTNHGLEYHKVRDGAALTGCLLERRDRSLEEISSLIKAVLWP